MPIPLERVERQFVNRAGELDLIQKNIQSICEGEPRPLKAITSFWGTFGIGKSRVLDEIALRTKQKEWTTTNDYKVVVARVNLDRLDGSELWLSSGVNKHAVIRSLWAQLAGQLAEVMPDLGTVPAQEWATAFVNQTTRWVENCIPILLFDTMDSVISDDESSFFWLEEYLFEPLALTDQVLMVVASRTNQMRWRRFQVRRRVGLCPLGPLDERMTAAELGASEAAGEVLYRHSFGHPLTTNYLCTLLEDRGINLREASRVTENLKDADVQTVLSRVVETVLENLPEGLPNLARDISVLRWINPGMMQQMAQDVDSIQENKGAAYYDECIAGLQKHCVLYWNPAQKAYAFDPVLRSLLSHSLELEDNLRFAKLHRIALSYHWEQMKTYPQYLSRFIPEIIYHHTILTHCGQTIGEVPDWQTWIQELSPSVAREEEWKALAGKIDGDADLRQLLSDESFEWLYSLALERAGLQDGLDRKETNDARLD